MGWFTKAWIYSGYLSRGIFSASATSTNKTVSNINLRFYHDRLLLSISRCFPAWLKLLHDLNVQVSDSLTWFKPTKASALSRSVSWYCCSGPRLFPHGPFSPTRNRVESCSLLSGAPAHGPRNSFTIRAKLDTDDGSCLRMNKFRKAITSRVPASYNTS